MNISSLPDANLSLQAGQAQDLVQKKLQIDQLKSNLGEKTSKDAKMREACEGFESIFIQKMWEQMRKNVPKDGYLHSKDEETYQGMFDQEFAKKMSQAGGMGLADMLYQQLNQRLGESSRGTTPQSAAKVQIIPASSSPSAARFGKVEGKGDNTKTAEINGNKKNTENLYSELPAEDSAANEADIEGDASLQAMPMTAPSAAHPENILSPENRNVLNKALGEISLDLASNPESAALEGVEGNAVNAPLANTHSQNTMSSKELQAQFQRQMSAVSSPLTTPPSKALTPFSASARNAKMEKAAELAAAEGVDGTATKPDLAGADAEKFKPLSGKPSPKGRPSGNSKQAAFLKSQQDSQNNGSMPNGTGGTTGTAGATAANAFAGNGSAAANAASVQAAVAPGFSWKAENKSDSGHSQRSGVDLAVPAGTPVKACSDGTIVSSGPRDEYSNMVVIEHQNGLKSYYGNVTLDGTGFKPGDKVMAGTNFASISGQASGKVNNTQENIDSHLHFELRRGEMAINAEFLAPQLVSL